MPTDNLAKRMLVTTRKIQIDVNTLIKPQSEIAPSHEQPVLPIALVKRSNRPYLIKVVHQINGTYSVSCYDACSVMLRRLIETLIIEVYENYRVADEIKDSSGEFKSLKFLIEALLGANHWNLSRNTKKALNSIKNEGDLSAHNRRYNAHREDIDKHITDLRVTVQELLSLASLN